ncbi:MAG: radical SAM protein [Bacteroidetes bacterium]|nr:radical SAM protein [Bacteroidota bacterium]
MKIAVAVPSITDFYFSPPRAAALGAATVVRALQLAGHETVFFNFMRLGKKSIKVPLPEKLSYLTEIITKHEFGPTAFFTDYKRMGQDPTICADQIISTKPDAVWISCFAFAYSDDALLLANAIRKIDSIIPITIGGGGPSALPSYFLRNDSIDAVCIGEVEPDIKNLLTQKSSEKSSFTSEKTMIFVPVVMPPHRGIVRVSLSLTRGCPKHCAFCSNFLTQGRIFRRTPLKNVCEEINRITVEPTITHSVHFAFEDDNILLDTEYFYAVLSCIQKKFPGATFSAENGLDYLLLTEEVIDQLIRFGITQFNLSAGSMNSSTLKTQRRVHNFQQLTKVLSFIHTKEVKTILYFICGLSEDTPESVVDALLELSNLPVDVGISPFYAVPGLPEFEETELFLNNPAYLCKGSSLFPWNNSLTTGQLMTAFRLARLVNLCNHPDQDRELLDICFQSGILCTRVRGKNQNKPVPAEFCDNSMVDRFFQNFSTNVWLPGSSIREGGL